MVVEFLGTTVIDFLLLIPEATMSSAALTAQYLPNRLGTDMTAASIAAESEVLLVEMVGNAYSASSSTEFGEACDIVQNTTTVIVSWFTSALALPWTEPVTFTVAGALAFANGTWSLTRLAPLSTGTAQNFSFATIQYFQVGYIFDWFRGAAVAAGEVIGFFTVPACLTPTSSIATTGNAFWGLIWLVLGAAQSVIEMFVQLVFMNSFYFAASGAPFQPLTVYCNSNASQVQANYRLMYNVTAAWAVVFGCNASLSPVPLESPLATCDDSESGAFVLAGGRLIFEILHAGFMGACNLPEMLTFKPPLQYSPPSPQIEAFPSNPPLINFGNLTVNLDALALQVIAFGRALQNALYFVDTDLVYGDPATGPCQFASSTSPSGTGYRISFFCLMGAISNTVILGVSGALYEVSRQLILMLGGAADTALFLQVRLPTLGDTIRDMELLGCLLGQLTGLVVPLAFSCSSQAPAQGNQLTPGPAPPPPQIPIEHPLVPFAQRSDSAQPNLCFYTASQWAATGNTCNCTAVTQLYSVNGTQAPECLLSCLSPGVTFPYIVGYDPFTGAPPNCSSTLVRTTFTNQTTLQRFLSSQFGPLGGGFQYIPSPSLDPTNETSPAYRPAQFMQELVAAQLNDYYNSIYQPAYTVFYNSTAAANCANFTIGVPLIDAQWLATVVTIMQANAFDGTGLTVHQIIQIITYIFYAQAAYPPANYQQLVYCNIPQFYGSFPVGANTSQAYMFLEQLLTFASVYEWEITSEFLRQFLVLYNSAHAQCDAAPASDASLCFHAVRSPTTPQPPLDPPASLPNPGDPATICTFTAQQYLTLSDPMSDFCGDCSEPYPGYFYEQGNYTCTLACTPGALPELLGARGDQCLTAAGCTNFASEVDSNLIRGAAYFSALNSTPWLPIGRNYPPESIDTNPGALYSDLLAAIYNLRFQHYYRPGQYIYMRTVGDSLFPTSCLENPLARLVFNGQSMDVIVDVINRLWIGNSNAPRYCEYLFRSGSARFTLCNLITTQMTPWFLNGTTASYSTNSTLYILPVLRAFNQWQNNCTLNPECFITTPFNVDDIRPDQPGSSSLAGPVNFTNPQYYSLTVPTTATIKAMTPCPNTLQCWAGVTCEAGRLLVFPFVVVSEVLNQTNTYLITTSPQLWQLGRSIWDMLENVTIKFYLLVSTLVLNLLTWLDCVICALAGNVPYDSNNPNTWACSASLFSIFKPMIVILQEVVVPLISLAIDTVELAVNVVYYFFAGPARWGDLVLAIITYLGKFSAIMLQLVGALFSMFFGAICGCTFWNLIVSNAIPCTQQCYCPGGCSGKKRAAMESLEPWTAAYMFQTFAPDWPDGPLYASMPTLPADACDSRLSGYAARVRAQGVRALTETEADEVAFCLGRRVLVNNGTSSYTESLQFDECAYLLRDAARTPSLQWADLTGPARAQLLRCIQTRGAVYGLKRGAQGLMEWLPDSFLTMAANPIATWIPMISLTTDALRAQSERYNDATYTNAVINSHEYETQLHHRFGPARVALLRRARTTGEVGSVADYTHSILAGAAAENKRRSTYNDGGAYVHRVTSLAELMTGLRRVASSTFLGETLMPVLDDFSASMPPTHGTSGAKVATTTAYLRESFGGDMTDDNATTDEQSTHTLADRIQNTLIGIARVHVEASPPPPPPTSTNTLNDLRGTTHRDTAASRKRSVFGPPAPKRPSVLRLIFRGTAGTLTAARELLSGAAQANATAIASSATRTAFKWLEVPKRVANDTIGIVGRIQRRIVQPLFGGMMRRYALLMDAFRELGARDTHTIERSRRLAVMSQAIRNAYDLAMHTVPSQPVAKFERPSASMKRALSQSNATVPTEHCFNITTVEVCEQCIYINNWLGYTALATRQVVWYYNVSNSTQFVASSTEPANFTTFGPNPQIANSIAYAYATFLFINNYTLNITRTPLLVGNSPNNPARFPNINVPIWDYLDDTVPNKTGFRAYEPLFNATWTAFLELLANIDIFSATDSTAVPVVSSSSTTSTPHVLPAGHNSFDRIVLNGVFDAARRISGQQHLGPWLVGALGNSSSTALAVYSSQAEFSAAQYDTWREILDGWWNLILDEFIICRYDSELDGTNVRYSLMQGAVLVGIPAVLLGWLISAVPAFELLSLFFVVPMFLRPIIRAIGPIVGFLAWIGFSTGWKLLCSPTFPSIVVATQGMQLLTTSVLLNKCPIIGSGLVQQSFYDNTNCMVGSNWADGVFSLFSCRDDLGWTSPLDLPVFLLRACQDTQYVCSGWLEALQTPSDFNVFLASILRLPIVSEWLHRWDNVDLSDAIGYSSQYTCAYILTGVWIILFSLLGYLLAFGPVGYILEVLLALFAIVITGGIMLIFAFWVVVYAMLAAPMTLLSKMGKTGRDS